MEKKEKLIVVKRDGGTVEFNGSKISVAIKNANRDVEKGEQASDVVISEIVDGIRELAKEREVSVEEIQDIVETELASHGLYKLAKEYIVYRYKRQLVRRSKDTDNAILALIRNEDKYCAEENSNKDAARGSTQRDYITGIVSKDISERILLPEKVVQAHESGAIHFHDLDYFIQPIPNCCLNNIQDILDNGTVINKKLIETPKSFQVACTQMTQVIATVASNQYGGQSVNVRHLGKYLKKSEDKYRNLMWSILAGDLDVTKLEADEIAALKKYRVNVEDIDESGREAVVELVTAVMLKNELAAGVQTIQYQINTLMTTNGQAPFVTLFLELDEEHDEYIKYTAMIIEEILRQRLQGIKNESGVWITPAFPKLVYVLDEHNCLRGGKYDHLTKLAVKCSAKRMYPDYISAKKMRAAYEGNVFSPMGCRSFLAPWKDKNGDYVFEGRFNQGVVSLNLPQIAILAKKDEDKFWEILEDRLSIAFMALMCRHEALESVSTDVSPLHWRYGAIARLKPGENFDKLLHGGYSSISLGYIGVYEMTMLMKGVSHTNPKGKEFALRVMQRLKDACDNWKKSTGIGFALYGTPAESLCYRFAQIDAKQFGMIKDVTDKGYYTNSYHVDVREKIDAFAKLRFESEFQEISTGGAISYVEIPYMMKNLEALESLIPFIYDTIRYAEINTKSDYCQKCGYSGEIGLNENGEWECPQCHNTDKGSMNVVRRTCGYLGENFWNEGKTKEISERVTHL